jgi:Post-segregation antitoxin CcdA
MPRVSVWVPDLLYAEARKRKVNFSAVLRAALEAALREGEAAESVDVTAHRIGDEIVITLRAD